MEPKTLFGLVFLGLFILVKPIVIYAYPWEMPSFPGDSNTLHKFLSENLQYPKWELEWAIQGTVVVGFVIDLDGSLTNIKIVRKVSPGLDAEALRVVSLMPKWNPARFEDKPVRVKFNLPIRFKWHERTLPSFPGGSVALANYIEENVRRPKKSDIIGIVQDTVIVKFFVEADGRIADVSIARNVSPACDAEALRLVSKMPKWYPGTESELSWRNERNSVRVEVTLPIIAVEKKKRRWRVKPATVSDLKTQFPTSD